MVVSVFVKWTGERGRGVRANGFGFQSGMAVVLVEGEDKLAELVGSNPSSGKATDGA